MGRDEELTENEELHQLAAHLDAVNRADLIRGILVLSPFILFGVAYLLGHAGLQDTTLASIVIALWILSIPVAILIVLFGFGLRILGVIVGTISAAWGGATVNRAPYGAKSPPQDRMYTPLDSDPIRDDFDPEAFGYYSSEHFSDSWYALTSKPYTPIHGFTETQKDAINLVQARRDELEEAREEAAELRAELSALEASFDEDVSAYEDEIGLLRARLAELGEGES